MWGNDNRNGPGGDALEHLRQLFAALQLRQPDAGGLEGAMQNFPWLQRLAGAFRERGQDNQQGPPYRGEGQPDPPQWMRMRMRMRGHDGRPGDGPQGEGGAPSPASSPGGTEPGMGRPRWQDNGPSWWKTEPPMTHRPGQPPRTGRPPRRTGV